jgi:hypothetical protein
MASKKGFVYSPKNNPLFDTQISILNLGWYYTWGLNGSSNLQVKFTPMCWGAPSADKLGSISQGTTELLAFNEPDGAQQSNLTVQQIISMWPKLQAQAKATGSRLGSIATAQNPMNDNSYFDQVWNQLNPVDRPDFICLHWYAPPNADHFLGWLDDIHTKYQKPIWITEMCVADWKATQDVPERWSTDQIQAFMDHVVAGMNQRSYVERFAWKTRPTTDVFMGNGALIAMDGSLTQLGKHYSTL